jgi:hypothetical protein
VVNKLWVVAALMGGVFTLSTRLVKPTDHRTTRADPVTPAAIAGLIRISPGRQQKLL